MKAEPKVLLSTITYTYSLMKHLVGLMDIAALGEIEGESLSIYLTRLTLYTHSKQFSGTQNIMHNWRHKFQKQIPYLGSECSTFYPHAMLLSQPWSCAESRYHPSKSQAGTRTVRVCGWRLRDSNAVFSALQLWCW